MSFDACSTVGPSTEAGPAGDQATGMDAINLERQGWIPPADQYDAVAGGAQTSVRLHALSDPAALNGASPYLDAHVPAAVPIADGSTAGTTSDYVTAEYRQAIAPGGTETWDYGAGDVRDSSGALVPVDAVVLHLHTPTPNPNGGDSYLVDTDVNNTAPNRLPQMGALSPSLQSDEFTDTATHTYLAVNSVDPATWTATVTVSSSPITSTVNYGGATEGAYGDTVTLEGTLVVAGSGAVVPNEAVTLSAGTQSCQTTTNLQGQASCSLTLQQGAGPVPLTATSPGSAAYAAVDDSVGTFTVSAATTTATYSGPTTAIYGSAVDLAGTLTAGADDRAVAGAPVTFTAGSQSCQATTDGSGRASCLVTLDQNVGDHPLSETYAGSSTDAMATSDSQQLAISAAPLTITADNAVKAYGSPDPTLSFSAAGLEDGDTAADLGPVVCTRAAGESPGTYPVTCSGADDPNYATTYQPGSLVITRPAVAACAATAGGSQSAAPGVIFATPLTVRCLDATGQPRDGVFVTYSVTTAADSGHFASGAPTASATTGIDGTASADLYAGPLPGAIRVTAVGTGVGGSTTFTETVSVPGTALPVGVAPAAPATSPVATPNPSGTSKAGSGLAFTGAPSAASVAAAFLLIDIGAVAVMAVGRRRRRT